jgi:DnaJ-class molecular chaperone
MILIPIILFAGFCFILIKVFQWLSGAASSDEGCSRCGGRGFWYGARGKEKCDWCKGSGRMPKGLS